MIDVSLQSFSSRKFVVSCHLIKASYLESRKLKAQSMGNSDATNHSLMPWFKTREGLEDSRS